MTARRPARTAHRPVGACAALVLAAACGKDTPATGGMTRGQYVDVVATARCLRPEQYKNVPREYYRALALQRNGGDQAAFEAAEARYTSEPEVQAEIARRVEACMERRGFHALPR